jgi:M6 family metalloprotease-like protein
MKKGILLLIFLLASGFSAFASPPHPLNRNPTGRERQDPTIGSREPLYKSLMRKGASGRARSSPFANIGFDMHVLVLLVNFSDETMNPVSNPAFYKTMLETGSGLTMKKYYQDMSQGNLNLTFDVEGPYTVSRPLAYYGANDASGYDEHPGELVKEALQLFVADKGLAYNYAQYDNNSDGFVDGIFVIHAERGEESYGGPPDAIWSNQFTLIESGMGIVTAPDGTKFNTYTIEPEYTSSPGDSSIGIFCHEFAHVLGLPDLYDVNYITGGVAGWSLMAIGQWGSHGYGTDPAPLLAWERYFVGGGDWITLTELGSSAQNVSIQDIKTSHTAFTISLNSPGQYPILEGKTKVVNDINPFVPAWGILITQIHEGVIDKYGLSASGSNLNTVVTGFNRVHGIDILEAATAHDEAGRGALWTRSGIPPYAFMPFSSETRSYLRGYEAGARGPLFPAGFPAWPVCAAVAAVFFFLGKARRKPLFPVFAATLALSAFLLTCSMDGSDDNGYIPGPGPHPNSNYYLSEDIYSKTGISGVTLSNISSRTVFPMTFDLTLE